MKKPPNVKWAEYIKYGLLKLMHKKIIRRTHQFLVFLNRPLREKIGYYKKGVKKYSCFTKGYKDYSKYYILYKTIRKLKPWYVLECGSGITTIIIALALKENGVGKFVSIDELSRFGNTTAHLVKEAGLDVEMHISPSREDRYEGIQGNRYQTIPDYPYDFVFIDGPVTNAVDLDAFSVLQKNPKAKVLIDCRAKTVRALQTEYKGRFSHFVNLGYINW